MRGAHNIIRLVRTGATLQRTGAMTVMFNAIEGHRASKFFARAVFGLPFSMFGLRGDTSLPPVPRALTALGPAYVKFGQLLSTRPDVVGGELAAELRILLDKLPPFSSSIATETIRKELSIDVNDVFSEFSEPIAAASIAQVHKAMLRENGRQVAVKVLRPGIEKAFKRDIDAFYLAAWMTRMFLPASRRLKPYEVVEHFEGVVLRELDLRMEAAAAAELASTHSRDPTVSIPPVSWWLSGKRVVTVDWAEGINFGDVEGLRQAGHDLEDLSRRLIQMFLRQALRDGYFHADLHQGNMKVSTSGQIVLLDFGIMGRIDTFTRRVYAEILMGFIEGNYDRVAEVHFEAGYVPADQNVHDFSLALRSVGEPIFGMDASRISVARLLAHLFEVTEQFGMQTRTELLLLQRTMVVVEGVARSLDPHLNMWEVARPVVQDYIREHVGPVAMVRDLSRAARVLSRMPPHFPAMINTLSERINPKQDQPPTQGNRGYWLAALAGAAIATVLLLTLR